MCMLVIIGNKMAGRKALLSKLSFPNDPILPSSLHLRAYCSAEEKEEEAEVVVKIEGKSECASFFSAPPSAIINRKIFLKDPLMASPNAKPDIFLADGPPP